MASAAWFPPLVARPRVSMFAVVLVLAAAVLGISGSLAQSAGTEVDLLLSLDDFTAWGISDADRAG